LSVQVYNQERIKAIPNYRKKRKTKEA